jgi:hypothetical protein
MVKIKQEISENQSGWQIKQVIILSIKRRV